MNLNFLKRRNKFCIVFHGRSGSTWLCTLLDGHRDIVCKREIFHNINGQRMRNKNFPDSKSSIEEIEKLYSEGNTKAVGFKFKYPFHFWTYPEIEDYLIKNKDEVKIIHLYRDNLLKTAISSQNRDKLKKTDYDGANFYIEKKDSLPEVEKIDLDIEKAIKSMNKLEEQNEFYKNYLNVFPKKITITYEDLYTNTQDTLDKILDFLEVERIALQDGTIKITSNNIKEALSNYNEVEMALKDTKYSVYLQ